MAGGGGGRVLIRANAFPPIQVEPVGAICKVLVAAPVERDGDGSRGGVVYFDPPT